MSDPNDSNCPLSLPVPISITVNTSADAPTPIAGHSLASSHSGFTRISKFTFNPLLGPVGTTGLSIQDSLIDLSISTAVWDFGDGHTLSGDNVFSSTHTYNVPGVYTVTVFFYDKDGNSHINTLTEQLSVYNYASTRISISVKDVDTDNPISITAGKKPVQGDRSLGVGLTASWQDVPDPDEPHTVYFTASGSKAKPYDINNKYAHLIPYSAFYDKNINLINSIDGVQYQLNPQYFFIDTNSQVSPITSEDQPKADKFLLYSSTRRSLNDSYGLDLATYRARIHTASDTGEKFYYYDDIINYIGSDRVNLLIRLDTSTHKLKNFYIDNLVTDINLSERNHLETNFAGVSTDNVNAIAGIPIKIIPSAPTRLSFTSTGMKEMSAIQYKRQGDKFQLFIGLADEELNIGKYFSQFFHEPTSNFISLSNGNFADDHTSTLSAWTATISADGTPLTGWHLSAGIGAAHFAHTGGVNNLYQDVNTVLGKEYEVSLTISSRSTGWVRLFLGTTDPSPPYSQDGLTENKTHIILVDADNTQPQRLYIQATEDFDGIVSDVSIDCNQFFVEWVSGATTSTSNISSLSTTSLPYNLTTEKTELSSFLYLNIDPVDSGTWTLNVTGRQNNFSSLSSLSAYGQTIDYDSTGPYGSVSLGVKGTNIITGSYTFTISPSTNDVEIYKINEDIDYSQVLKSYRFQSFLHEYDNLFDGVFTSFVGQASSSPTVFGKTIFEKTANFVSNNTDIDFCKIENIQAFYDFFNEDIDFVSPNPPPELKRLYNLFSIKISKLLGDYHRVNDNFDTQYYTSSAAGRNIDFTSPITSLTYEVTADTKFVALQKFNSEYILIKPQQVPAKSVDGSTAGVSATYPLSTYNVYSNWGWELDTTVSGASGLDLLYEFYPYTAYDTTLSAENIENSIIDYNNPYTTISRSTSSLSASWENDGGIIFNNLDYQLRKGLSL